MVRSLLALIAILSVSCIQTAPPPETSAPTSSAPASTSGREQLPAAATPAKAGAACLFASECESGVCEGQGCGDIAGLCADKERMCTMDLVPYCGCDGKTFYGSSGCPKQRFSNKGECTGQGGAQPASQRPDGGTCDRNEDCASGVCEGQGCGSKQGVCAAKNRRCTRDRVSYCGCDGTTFTSSGSCPGQRFSKRGTCEAPSKNPVGAACDTANQCDSGVCEGMGCGPGQGVCASKRRACTRDLRAYCGCDGNTFRASGSCPMKRFSKRGGC